MSELENLIQRLCPDGVEYKNLGEVVTFNRGTAITQKDIQSGDIPVIAGGQKPAYYCNTSNREGQTIVIAGSGAYAGFVSFWDKPIFVSDAFSVNAKSDVLVTRYLYHFLLNEQSNIYAKKKEAECHMFMEKIWLILKSPCHLLRYSVKLSEFWTISRSS